MSKQQTFLCSALLLLPLLNLVIVYKNRLGFIKSVLFIPAAICIMATILNSIASGIFFGLLLVLVQSYSEDDMAQAVDKCMTANNIDREEYVEILNKTEDTVDRKYKCFVYCLGQEMHIVDSSGYVDVELVEQHGKLSEKNRAAFSECTEQNQHISDMCNYAYKYVNCLSVNLDTTEFNNESK
ncbi:general odorant-binding protein 57c-like isoform X1 [Drosophila innubila]|uniref:general odorant-binding protein 57c-like isoform X1 n=1 Tax=Drosophila innubila TaxID=198719 RepID=UPI00148E71F4|nr:general odorant-binding protein 57c-like isoform X1 [Drosophila innubila]